jgi:cyclic beta-1,2-glucan synthetase
MARVVRRIGATLPSLLVPLASSPQRRPHVPERRRGDGLALDNGFGGIGRDGDYHIRVNGNRVPPAPWSNIIANRHGGFMVTERGGGCTWAENSYFFRLTPWHNDPVSDPVSEVIYLQDEESDELWCATPAPIGGDHFTVRHAPGTSSFSHQHGDIASHLILGLAPDEAVKLSVLRLSNRGDKVRRLRITTYMEWTLGVLREHTQHQVQTRFDRERETLLATNYFDPSFAGWTGFHCITEPVIAYTAGRRDFLGRNRSVANPAALLDGGNLSGVTGAGIDPCAALQCSIELAPGEDREIGIVLGAAETELKTFELATKYRELARAKAAMDETIARWSERLSVITVKTPEPTFDTMINRWTLYQALSCRMWGRSAVYQSSGAYGFRDQLQDVLAFLYAEPALAREHILRAAGRQFVEGDVQHWWHPHSGRGVRTRFSDDLAWLPYVVDQYIRVTGDGSVLDEPAPFLTMRELGPEEHEIYDLPEVSSELASVYQHCVRALQRACTTGEHGLPLIGIGDWNDGMNRVGIQGKGESVWLAWFLATTLKAFAEQADSRGDVAIAAQFRGQAATYLMAVEQHGWDGEWYRRAYFDDGTPIGSRTNEECRIDSIAQSWSVISGEAGRRGSRDVSGAAGQRGSGAERRRVAMNSLEKYLVRENARLIMLLTPAFDKTEKDPGYIKGYLPGVRENGAQYTHAALWAVLATALQGNGNRAFELYQMINPLTHARTPEEVEVYKVEPYVVAADVYTAEGQLGRGGWTWYTGSASWMYRVGLEGILGFTKRGDRLFIEPRAPASWSGYSIEYRYGKSVYVIVVHNEDGISGGAVEITIDGAPSADGSIRLEDDGARHEVSVQRVRTGVRQPEEVSADDHG